MRKCIVICSLLSWIVWVQSRCVTEETSRFNTDNNTVHSPKYSMHCSVTLATGTSLAGFMLDKMDRVNDTQALTFVKSKLRRIPMGTFTHLPDLHLLDIRHSAVRVLDPGAMHGLTNLHILFLNNNNISQLSNGVLNNLGNLRILHLSHNNLSFLDVSVFQGLNKLQTLHLDNNQIKSINNSAHGSLSQVAYINLQNNHIKQLHYKEFWSDPTAYMNRYIPQISSANLNDTSLGPIFNMWPWLEMFKASYETFNQIWLNNNKIAIIHEDSFVNLTALLFLNLGNNQIESIAIGTFRQLSSLVYLDLSYNNIQHLEYGLFTGLVNLEILNLCGNRIKYLEINVLYPLTNIRILNFSGNSIQKFDANKIVNYFRNITKINLNNNKLHCSWLTETLYLLKSENITILPGNSYKTNNVQGIECF